jgi:hypothetical protein
MMQKADMPESERKQPEIAAGEAQPGFIEMHHRLPDQRPGDLCHCRRQSAERVASNSSCMESTQKSCNLYASFTRRALLFRKFLHSNC